MSLCVMQHQRILKCDTAAGTLKGQERQSFETEYSDLFSGTFNDVTPDKITLPAKTGIVHAFLVVAGARNSMDTAPLSDGFNLFSLFDPNSVGSGIISIS